MTDKRTCADLDSLHPAGASTESISRATIGHYDANAEDFRDGTWSHDVSQNLDALLRNIEGEPPFDILDFGCGPGRDLVALKTRGHRPVGLDGAIRFVEMAREASGCEVLHQDFLALDLPQEKFDGIFANASLFHVPKADLPRVLRALRAALKRRGVLFSSNPRGENREGFYGDRFGAYHDHEAWRAYLVESGFDEIEHYYRPPGRPREQQPWLASVWRRRG